MVGDGIDELKKGNSTLKGMPAEELLAEYEELVNLGSEAFGDDK